MKPEIMSSGVLAQIIASTPVPMFVIDKDHTVVYWNEACEKVTGATSKEMVGTQDAWKPFYPEKRPTMADLVLEERFEDLKHLYAGKYKKTDCVGEAWEAEDYFAHFPDNGKWLSFSATALRDEKGNIIGAIEVLRDLTQQKRYEESLKNKEHLLSEVIEGCPVPMFVIDKAHTVTHWNKACEAVIGTKAKDIVGTKNQWKAFYDQPRPVLADIVLNKNVEQIRTFYDGIWSASPLIEDGWEATDHFPHFGGNGKWLYFTAAPLHDKDKNEYIGAVETLQDVSDQKQYEEKLEFQANHDSLTGLANRTLLTDRLNQAIAHASRDERYLALLFIDLDNFKTVNDTLGHRVGDHLICDTARKIKSAVRSGDTVARLGGDEFVVLLFAPENEDHVTDIVQRIIKEVNTSYRHENTDIHIGCSVGVSMFPQDGLDSDTLMMNADSAMYRVKSADKGSFHFFTKDLNERALTRLQIENDLHAAISNNQFELVYQPIFDLHSMEVIAAEALIRWNHPEKGLIMPIDFIDIAEETGLIVPIGEWVLKTAVQEALYWEEHFNQPLRISVNVSARQFRNCEIHKALEKVYDEWGKPVFSIELELTENLVMQNPAQAEGRLEELRKIGAHLAMDDFGTGYSSLAYLRRFPFDMIKIDKAFVNDLGQNDEADAIVRAMLELGRALGLNMLAEGVETQKQLNFLKREGCGEVQGYFFSKPLQTGAFRDFLAPKQCDVKKTVLKGQ